MAFLVMDLAFEGRRDLACAFADAYFAATGDAEGRALLPFYTSYRAAVRAKVEGMRLAEPEVPEAERAQARDHARALWLLALGELEVAGRRPCLVLVGGLPGVGKSTLAGDLAELAGFEWIRSDQVRKDLAGLSDSDRAPAAFGEGLYTPEWNERTNAECRRRAEALLLQGKRVVVDASFRTKSSRRLMLDIAARLRVPGLFLLCRAERSVVRERLASRRDDASDADWTIHLEILERWEEPSADTSGAVREVDAGASRAATLASALQILREWNLAAETPTDAPAAPT